MSLILTNENYLRFIRDYSKMQNNFVHFGMDAYLYNGENLMRRLQFYVNSVQDEVIRFWWKQSIKKNVSSGYK